MLSPNNNLAPLPFYFDLGMQRHNNVEDQSIFMFISHRDRFPSFQIMRPYYPSNIDSVVFKLFNSETNEEVMDVSSVMREYTTIEQDITVGTDYIVYGGNSLGIEMPLGLHYLMINDGLNKYYSENFSVCINANDFVQIEYWSDKNQPFSNSDGLLVYENGYKNYLYVKSEFVKPQYEFNESSEERQGTNYNLQLVSVKALNFEFKAPEFICNTIRALWLADYVNIIKDSELYEIESINPNIEWPTSQFAIVNLVAYTRSAIVKTGRGVVDELNQIFVYGRAYKDSIEPLPNVDATMQISEYSTTGNIADAIGISANFTNMILGPQGSAGVRTAAERPINLRDKDSGFILSVTLPSHEVAREKIGTTFIPLVKFHNQATGIPYGTGSALVGLYYDSAKIWVGVKGNNSSTDISWRQNAQIVFQPGEVVTMFWVRGTSEISQIQGNMYFHSLSLGRTIEWPIGGAAQSASQTSIDAYYTSIYGADTGCIIHSFQRYFATTILSHTMDWFAAYFNNGKPWETKLDIVNQFPINTNSGYYFYNNALWQPKSYIASTRTIPNISYVTQFRSMNIGVAPAIVDIMPTPVFYYFVDRKYIETQSNCGGWFGSVVRLTEAEYNELLTYDAEVTYYKQIGSESAYSGRKKLRLPTFANAKKYGIDISATIEISNDIVESNVPGEGGGKEPIDKD